VLIKYILHSAADSGSNLDANDYGDSVSVISSKKMFPHAGPIAMDRQVIS
jgi:hypothetical protein